MAQKKKKSKALQSLSIFLCISVGIILLLYLGIAFYFKTHYLFNTTIGNVDCSLKTPEYSIDKTASRVEGYLLTIYDKDGNKFLLRGPDFSYRYVPTGKEDNILQSQNIFSWPKSLWTKSSYPLDTAVTYDKTQAALALKALDCFASDSFITAPENAYLLLNEDGYEVVKESVGNTLIYENVLELVLDAIDHQVTALNVSEDYYEKPEILSDDVSITSITKQLDSFMKATVTYDIDGPAEGLSETDIYHMLQISSDNEVSLNTEKVKEYVQKLASKYNTFGDRRSFETSMGDTIQIGGGDYGWVIDKSKEAKQLALDLQGGEPVYREPFYEQTAMDYGPDDIGTTYVEVDYTNQHLWYYQKGRLAIESDFVSGNLEKGNGSPDGLFKIVYKKKDATLVGEDYESDVDYFMPFAYNVGFHDASWRSNFGGDIYRTKGSHGCINLPHDTAEFLYKELTVGTPVIAFYREDIKLTSKNASISNAYSYVNPETLLEE